MAEWTKVTLPEVLEFREGPGIMAADFADQGTPLIRLAGVKQGAHILAGCNFLDPEKVAKRWSQFQLKEGDVLLSTSASLGEVAVVGPDGVGAVPYTGLIAFRPRSDEIDPSFIRHMLAVESFKQQIAAMGVGSVMKHFGPTHLRKMFVSYPSRSEQRAIAEVLGALDDKIAANAAMSRTAQTLLSALFAATELDVRPGAGEGRSLSEFIELNPKIPAPRESESVYVDMQKLPTSEMSIAQWSHRPARGGARFQNGDTLLARITPCLENRKTGFVDFLQEGQIALGSTEYIVMRSIAPRHPGVAFFLATSTRFREFAIRHMSGTSGRQRLAAKDLLAYEVSDPGPKELRRFELAASTLMPRVAAATRENAHLVEMRDALLPALMSGRLRVKDAETIVEDVV